MTISVLPTASFPPDSSVEEMHEHLLMMWPGVHATARVDDDAYRRAFNRFERLKHVLESADVEPCPVWWCSSGTHSWSYQLHHAGPGDISRHDRVHGRQVSDEVGVELIEFDPSCYGLGEVDPGDDQPVVSVQEVDLRNPQEVEAHIAALREAARIAFGEVDPVTTTLTAPPCPVDWCGEADDPSGEPVLSTEGMAVLFGVDPELIGAEYRRQGSGEGIKFPKAWVPAGRRRAREYMAATGRQDMAGAVEWWRGR